MTQKQFLNPWTIDSCPCPHNICPMIWKNKFINHEIHCNCYCHYDGNKNIELSYSVQGSDTLVIQNAKKQVMEEV